MDFIYMKKLAAEKQIGKIAPREPMTNSEIVELENLYNQGKKFPEAFREYLILAGNWGGEGVVDPDFDDVREYCEEDMETWGNKLNRPFFVFDKLDSQYSIFFLDEDKEDPDVYIFNASWDINDTEPLLKMSFTGTFSNMINTAIYHIKNDLPF